MFIQMARRFRITVVNIRYDDFWKGTETLTVQDLSQSLNDEVRHGAAHTDFQLEGRTEKQAKSFKSGDPKSDFFFFGIKAVAEMGKEK